MTEVGAGLPPVRVALYSGLCIERDAISYSLRLKLEILERWRAAGVPVEATAFVHCSGYEDDCIRHVESVSHLLRIPEFRAADVHIFEFGIYYPLFDAVFLLADGVPAIAVYHNITPPELADDPRLRSVLERSFVQRHNLSRMSLVASDSEYNRLELLELGLPAERLSVLPLPPALPQPFKVSDSRHA